MAAALAGLGLSELGFGSAVGGAVGSEAIGAAAQGAAAGAIGSGIEKGVQSAAEAVFGAENVQNFEKDVRDKANRVKNEFANAGYILSGNFDGWLEAKKKERMKHDPESEGSTFGRCQCPQSTSLGQASNAPPKDPEQVGQDFGTLLGKLADVGSQANVQTFAQAANSIIDNHPELSYLVGDALDLPALQKNVNAVVPNNADYKAIAAVYNGKRITTQSVKEMIDPANGQKVFGAIDELGYTQLYRVNPNAFTITPLHGTWVGPNSPNNALPEDLFDTYCFYHDVDYHNGGWFNRTGDYKLISRLSQNLDRFPSYQLPLIFTTIRYFSTIGSVLSNVNSNVKTPLTGPLSNLSNVPTVDVSAPLDDSASPSSSSSLTKSPVDEAKSTDYAAFNRGLVTGLVSQTRASSAISQQRTYRRNASRLKNIRIQVF